MHWQSQISIICDNGVERAHKSKNADKTQSDKLYEQGGYKRKKKEKSVCVDPRSGTDGNQAFNAASLETSSGCRRQT